MTSEVFISINNPMWPLNLGLKRVMRWHTHTNMYYKLLNMLKNVENYRRH